MITAHLAVVACASIAFAQFPSTRVRVVDRATARPVVGATVHAVTSPFPLLVGDIQRECVEATTDNSGTARLELDPTRSWTVWATKRDGASARFASLPHVAVTLGRPLRIELEPFALDRITIENLDAWREVLDGDTRLTARISADRPSAWLGDLRRSHDECRTPVVGAHTGTFVAPSFDVALAATDSSSFVVPPVPLGSFFVELVRADGRVLDSRRALPLTSVFGVDSSRYDIDASETTLRYCDVARLPLRAVTVLEQPIPRLRVWQTLSNASSRDHAIETTDDGTAHVFCSATSGSEATIPRVRAFDPRIVDRSPYWPRSDSLDLKLRAHKARFASIRGIDEHAAVYYVEDDLATRVELNEDGAVRLPAHRRFPWSLVAVHGGHPVVLADHVSSPRGDFTIDMTSFRTVEVRARGRRNRLVRGGIIEILPEWRGLAPIGLLVAIDDNGTARVHLRPGTYALLAWNEKRGDCVARLVVPPNSNTATDASQVIVSRITLEEFRWIHGVVAWKGHDLDRGAVASETFCPSTPADCVARFSDSVVRLNAQGCFETRVSSQTRYFWMRVYDGQGEQSPWSTTKLHLGTEGNLVVEIQ
ncbi:MAG: hypothetical protein KDC95_07130 [Planctomycetes bacterium]|nr:hypothetical protein [Planctomycetota bacterium]